MEQLEVIDQPAVMTTCTVMPELPFANAHHQVHNSYHGINHMIGHHHSSSLAVQTSGRAYGNIYVGYLTILKSIFS